VLGERKVASIDNVDIESLHHAITKRDRPIRANRVLAVLSKMFSLSLKRLPDEDTPWRDQQMGNPCRGIGKNPERSRTRFFSQAELAALSEAIAACPDRRQADCLTLIMLTGCRPGEAIEARWEQFADGVWTKEASETKQRKLTHTPLAPAALELLERIRKGDDDRVFPGLKRLRAWPAIAEAAGLGKGARIYDLRHTFASIGAGGGLSLPIIGRLLGHTQGKTTAKYAHLSDDPLRDAATKITSVITGKDSDNVVDMRSRK